MSRPSRLFTDQDRAAVSAAIAEAERGTSAEIVVAVAARSGRYDRGEDLFALALALVVTTVLALAVSESAVPGAQWDVGSTARPGAAALLIVFLATYAAGMLLAARFFLLARLFVRRDEMLAEVKRAAVETFHRFHVQHTADATGMLVYASLAERTVWVVGDERVDRAVDAATWTAARDRVVKGFRDRDPAGGLVAAVTICGTALAEVLPVAPGDVDELSNELILID